MLTVAEPHDLSDLIAAEKQSGKVVAMVPTMGALHLGHRTLFEIAGTQADLVVASIFVNRLQFNNHDDFAHYPIQIERDIELLLESGVDVLYLPTAATMYGPNFSSRVQVGKISESFEGRSRPGHFDGVATVVTKLLAAGQPNIAIFGQKDFQQCAVIRQLIADLNLPIRMVIVPTVREASGLAMSSRNTRLSDEGAGRAASISQGLFLANKMFSLGQKSAKSLLGAVHEKIGDQATIDYIALVDPDTLDKREFAESGDVILVAVEIDGVRLIDNTILC